MQVAVWIRSKTKKIPGATKAIKMSITVITVNISSSVKAFTHRLAKFLKGIVASIILSELLTVKV